MRTQPTGLTLLEVVIASFLFSGLITVLGGVWVLHARAQARSSHLLVAADLADLEMNRALSLGFHAVAPSTGSFVQTWKVRGRQVEQRFNSMVEVYEIVVPDEPLSLKLVKVTVTFQEAPPANSSRSFTLSSIVSRER